MKTAARLKFSFADAPEINTVLRERRQLRTFENVQACHPKRELLKFVHHMQLQQVHCHLVSELEEH